MIQSDTRARLLALRYRDPAWWPLGLEWHDQYDEGWQWTMMPHQGNCAFRCSVGDDTAALLLEAAMVRALVSGAWGEVGFYAGVDWNIYMPVREGDKPETETIFQGETFLDALLAAMEARTNGPAAGT